MLDLLLVACAACQEAPKPRAPDAKVFDELIRKTNAMKAFVAEYHVRVPGDEHEKSIRIVYRAPGEMRIDIEDWMSLEMRDGVLEICGTAPGGSGSALTGRVAIGDMESEHRAKLREIVRAELPILAKDWEAGFDCGVILKLDVRPSRTDEKEDFQFQAGYDSRRTALLSWLEAWKSRDDVRYDGEDHLVVSTPRGARLSLSTKTGFIDSIEKELHGETFRFELASLDLDPKIDAKQFDLPPPPKDAKDASRALSSSLLESVFHSHRVALYQCIAAHVGDKSLPWDAETREHVRKILARFDENSFTAANAELIGHIREVVGQLGSAARERYKEVGTTDGEARGKLDAQYDAQRKSMAEQFEKQSRSMYSDMTISERTVPDAALRESLQEIDRRVFEETFAHVIADPLLELFDETISKAKAGG
jgi:hypothetical protein